MRHSTSRFVAVFVTIALVAAACGKDRSSTPATTPVTVPVTTPDTGAGPTTPATDPVPEVAMFGDAPWPCGPGDGANTDSGSEPGVTKDSINIAGGDDAGYAGAPGLTHEATDAIKAPLTRSPR